MSYSITIDGVDRTGDVINRSLIIEDIINEQVNTCSFNLIDRSNSGSPTNEQEVIVNVDDTRIFGGFILNVTMDKQSSGTVLFKVKCVDYTRLLDRNLVHKTYQNMTDASIISDIVNTYCPGFGITTTNVVPGVTINQIKFNYIQPSQAFRKICQLTGRNWYIDYNKDIHYFPLITNNAPFNITSSTNTYKNLRISKDSSQLKNRVYVRGGTKLSDTTVYSTKGDGVKRQFILPDKPHDVSVTVNGVAKTVGIKNINIDGFDWYLNYQEKYIEQDPGGTVLTSSDTISISYKYNIPILVAVEDTASINEIGPKEYAIFDKSIETTQAARDRASAELVDYSNSLVEGSFTTFTSGFKSGQYISINLSSYGINANYLIQKVITKSMGGGNFYYDISLASSKTMGIIRFLIELLEANKNLIELDDDEVIDELLSVQDSLLSDSLTENLTIDSCGPNFTWCTDSLQSTPITRARWELFQWG